MKTISITELNHDLINSGLTNFIDVRSASEYNSEHIDGFVNVPLDQLSPDSFDAETPIVLICEHGIRSKEAREVLKGQVKEVHHVDGGVSKWRKIYPTIKGSSQTISIMRQVQLIVGTFVTLSAVLSVTVNLHFVWIAAFFGSGLAFAGATNTCALGLLLSRMPWNKC